MQFLSTQKFLKISPKKLRMVVDEIKEIEPVKAVEILSLTNKKGAKVLAKVIKSALANAKMKGAVEADLFFKEIQVGEGPRLKRGNPVSRGRFHPIKKRMSHVRVLLEDKPVKDLKPKEKESKKGKNEKSESSQEKKGKK